jgi:hypothetical protein
MKTSKLALVFFLGITLVYLSLSPGAVFGMGYTGENVGAANQLIAVLGDWIKFEATANRVIWPRHGLFELLFELPFLLLSKLFFGDNTNWADRILSFQPILMTAAICTVIFIWVRRVTGSAAWAFVLGLVAALATMLWPYAYIGLETTQSLSLLLAAYLALGADAPKTWKRSIIFAIVSGIAIGVKSNGIFLAPAVAYLVFVYVAQPTSRFRFKIIDRPKAVVIVAIVIALYGINAFTRSLSPTWAGGSYGLFKLIRVDSVMTLVFNMFAYLASANKGLIMYAPVVLLALVSLPKAYKKDPRVVIFSILVLGGLMSGCGLFYFYADETWGPRYLHSSVAPLVVCVALSRESIRFRLRKELPLIALTLWGFAVSFLGAFYFYGVVFSAATKSGVATIETLQHDPNWNPIRFDLLLLQTWLRGGSTPVYWTPTRHWWWQEPMEAVPFKTINLRDYTLPQPSLVRGWSQPKLGSYRYVWLSYLLCLFAGPLLLVWLGFASFARDRLPARTRAIH